MAKRDNMETIKKVVMYAAIYEGAAYAINWFSYSYGYGTYLPFDGIGTLTAAPWTGSSSVGAYMRRLTGGAR
jgi:hypothetical protein